MYMMPGQKSLGLRISILLIKEKTGAGSALIMNG